MYEDSTYYYRFIYKYDSDCKSNRKSNGDISRIHLGKDSKEFCCLCEKEICAFKVLGTPAQKHADFERHPYDKRPVQAAWMSLLAANKTGSEALLQFIILHL